MSLATTPLVFDRSGVSIEGERRALGSVWQASHFAIDNDAISSSLSDRCGRFRRGVPKEVALGVSDFEQPTHFQKIYSQVYEANRSEIAIRVVRVEPEMNILSVAIYVKEDRHALHRLRLVRATR
jgi:hypothetical protein